MATHLIINARTKQVSASLDAPGDGTVLFSVDLAGDMWADFVYFAEQAHKHEVNQDWANRNRHLRAAIASLFSHLDGIVSEMFDLRRAADPSFASNIRRKDQERCSLKRKIDAIADDVSQKHDRQLPELDLDLKLLRDILNHPSVTKDVTDETTRDTVSYNGVDLYGLAVSEVTDAGDVLDMWLNEACDCYAYERFCDTKKVAEDLAGQLGAKPSEIDEF